MIAPANPHQPEYCVAWSEYKREMRQYAAASEPPALLEMQAPAVQAAPPTLDTRDLLDDLINRVFEHWPDMARYRDTAQIERMYDAQSDQRRTVVTVTVYDAGVALSGAALRGGRRDGA